MCRVKIVKCVTLDDKNIFVNSIESLRYNLSDENNYNFENCYYYYRCLQAEAVSYYLMTGLLICHLYHNKIYLLLASLSSLPRVVITQVCYLLPDSIWPLVPLLGRMKKSEQIGVQGCSDLASPRNWTMSSWSFAVNFSGEKELLDVVLFFSGDVTK